MPDAPLQPLQNRSSRLRTLQQDSAYVSPWSIQSRIKTLLWIIAWTLLCRWTPKYFSRWRAFILRLCGCKITGIPFVDSTAIIKFPWNLTLDHRACIGPRTNVYNLAPIHLKARCTISAQCYLIGGTHDFSQANLPLMVGDIVIGADAFLGIGAMVMPGIQIGDFAVIGAGSVVSRDIPPGMVAAGNPCKVIKPRVMDSSFGAGETNPTSASSSVASSPVTSSPVAPPPID